MIKGSSSPDFDDIALLLTAKEWQGNAIMKRALQLELSKSWHGGLYVCKGCEKSKYAVTEGGHEETCIYSKGSLSLADHSYAKNNVTKVESSE